MAWNDLTFVDCSLLTAAKMTQLQGNFAALAAGEPGAPPLHIDGVSSLATVHVSSGLLAPQVSSLGLLHVSSGLLAPGVSSHGLLHVSSGLVSPQVSSLGRVALGSSPTGTPQANTLYRNNVCKAWINFNGTGTIAIRESFNVTSITDNATGIYTITWDRDFANANYSTASNQNASGGAGCTSLGEDYAVRAVGSITVYSEISGTGRVDLSYCSIQAFGAQA